ncbi:MAG: DNRLRE domain-containing protein [Halobacteria archaeon]|nr:DNRLRE domain-containing protein [Halobacteria archaeon]
MIRLLPVILLSCLTSAQALADMAHITADRDNTLVEDPDGALSNGIGLHIRAGRTNQAMNSIRRGLVRFDVASALPANAIIDRVFLTLYQNSNNTEPADVSLHSVLADWGEAASFGGGGGAPAEPGDATWLHTFYDHDFWVQQGGHFVPHATATATVSGNEFYTWQSTVHMVNNVRLWLKNPERNFGWLVMGDESTGGTAKRFDSREGRDSTRHPMLTIEYHLPGN